jgi:hypothetical protein
MTFIPEELLSELLQALCLDYRSEQSTPFATPFSCNYQDIHVFCAIYIASSVLAKLFGKQTFEVYILSQAKQI